jgi:phosphatidylglycerophosphatase A
LIDKKFLLLNFWHFLALGFGAGISKKAPGTLGTLSCIPLFFLIAPLAFELQIGFVITLFFLGFHASNITSKNLRIKDPSCIVIDEIVAMLLILILINTDLISFVLSFILFRFFDIKKPFPINWVDRQVGGGLGIMLDDIIAALPPIIIINIGYLIVYAN